MLVEFSVDNYKSIKNNVKFSMVKSSKDELANFINIPNRKISLLNSAIIYGANASGKSNLLNAMAFMNRFVLNQFKIMQSTDKLPYYPFRLSTETEDNSSEFEIVFFIGDIKYRYGFEMDSQTIYSEWLYEDKKGKEAKLFDRDIEAEDYINKDKFSEGYIFFDKSEKKIRISENQLFIWKCDQDGGKIAQSILKWFNNMNMIDGTNHIDYINFTMDKLDNSFFKSNIMKLIKTADIGIDDINIKNENVPNDILNILPFSNDIKEKILDKGTIQATSIKTTHHKYDDNGEKISKVLFNLEADESKGTEKFFALSAPILDTLENGKVLIVDELDSSLHPILTQHLIKLFQDKNINTKNAQLIFATHDTNLLKPSLFRRDQIWFSEKDRYGATDIYSLVDFKSSTTIRETDNFEKHYIEGRYGAIPFLGKFEF